MSVPLNFTGGRTLPSAREPSGREGVKSDEIVKLLGHVGRHICEMDLGTHAAQIPASANAGRCVRAHLRTIGNAYREIYAPRRGGGTGINVSDAAILC